MVFTSLIPNTVSPVIKRALKIHGSGFSTDKTGMKIYMESEDGAVSKMLKILKIEDTLLTVGFPGTIAGDYRIRVKREIGARVFNARFSSRDVNKLEARIVIESISPSTGSPFGGT